MANSGSIQNSLGYLGEIAQDVIPALCVPLRAFAQLHDLPSDAPLVETQIFNPVTVSATLENPTDFQPSSAGVTYDAIPMGGVHLVQPFHLNNAEAQNRLQLPLLAQANLEKLAAKIMSVPISLLTASNFGSPVATSSAAAFGQNEIQALAAAIASPRRSLLLATSHYVRTIPGVMGAASAALPGFVGTYEASFATAESGIVGACCDPRCIAVGWAVPKTHTLSRQVLDTRTVSIAKLGIEILLVAWFDPNSRTSWASYECIMSAAVADSTACGLLSDGTA
jgi:hypothetical protein